MKTCTLSTLAFGTWHKEIAVSYKGKFIFSKIILFGAEKAYVELLPEMIDKIKFHNFTHYKFAENGSTKYKLENK